jgi:hypothetical protein
MMETNPTRLPCETNQDCPAPQSPLLEATVGGFVRIPKRLLCSTKIDRTAKLLLMLLMSNDRGGGRGSWPSVTRLAREIGAARDTIMDRFDWLESGGLIGRLGNRGRVKVWQVDQSCLWWPR